MPPNNTPENQIGIYHNLRSDQISQSIATLNADKWLSFKDTLESLFSLADIQQAIRDYCYEGISFNELHNILLTTLIYDRVMNSS